VLEAKGFEGGWKRSKLSILGGENVMDKNMKSRKNKVKDIKLRCRSSQTRGHQNSQRDSRNMDCWAPPGFPTLWVWGGLKNLHFSQAPRGSWCCRSGAVILSGPFKIRLK
jgi:hypothetical protein